MVSSFSCKFVLSLGFFTSNERIVSTQTVLQNSSLLTLQFRVHLGVQQVSELHSDQIVNQQIS